MQVGEYIGSIHIPSLNKEGTVSLQECPGQADEFVQRGRLVKVQTDKVMRLIPVTWHTDRTMASAFKP